MRRLSKILATAGTSLAAAALLVPVGAAGDEACGEGRVISETTAGELDADGNGFVCVDLNTGAVADDAGAFAEQSTGVDRNNNGIVCVKPEQGIAIDDRPEQTPDRCPPTFAAVPIS
jgi:hypothetical protein